MKRLLVVLATLVGILAMHGGVGTPARAQTATVTTAAMPGMPSMPDAPTMPAVPAPDHQQATCASPLPPSAIAAPRLTHHRTTPAAADGLPATVAAPGRPSGREPPRPRQLARMSLGVLRI